MSSDEILEILLCSKVFVSSSIWPEAFGIVNIEALAAGCQLCGFNKGALPEIQSNHDLIANELTVEALSEVMRKALRNSNKINSIESSKKVREIYSPYYVSNLWENFFKQTLQ